MIEYRKEREMCMIRQKKLRHYVAKPYVEVAGKNRDCRIRAIV